MGGCRESNVASSHTSLSSVDCVSTTFCIAVGESEPDSGSQPEKTVIERWNGSAWSIVSSPNRPDAPDGSDLSGVACTATTNCFAVGHDTIDNGYFTGRTLAERWNGSSWALSFTPNPGGPPNARLRGVACTSATNCFAVGDTLDANGRIRTLIERWNGTTWSIMPSAGQVGR